MNNDIWTELDGVTAHVIDDMMDLLGQEFPETVMSFGIQNYIIWYRQNIFVKSYVYKNNPPSVPELKDKAIGLNSEIEP